MKPLLIWNDKATTRFLNILVCIGIIRNVKVERNNPQNEALRRSVTNDVRQKYELELLKDNPTVRAYRDLFWKLNIDPTKTRPSGEALLRRFLHSGEIPQISTVVDAYNLASLKIIIPLSGFNLDLIFPPLRVRFSTEGEEFQGIGTASTKLAEGMLVLADENRILCVYPHRDAEATKITEKTKNVLIVGYGAPNIHQNQLADAVKTALTFISLTCGGDAEPISIFRPSKMIT